LPLSTSFNKWQFIYILYYKTDNRLAYLSAFNSAAMLTQALRKQRRQQIIGDDFGGGASEPDITIRRPGINGDYPGAGRLGFFGQRCSRKNQTRTADLNNAIRSFRCR